MSATNVFSLSAIRTDGWFERVGERVGSFEALCHVLGERFFAFSLITGARIIALTVDRRNPAQSIVEFEISGAGEDTGPTSQTLPLAHFQRRLVSALVTEENPSPAPTRETDIEGIQRHIGVRYLLLAPLFGYSLLELSCEPEASRVRFSLDGDRQELELEELQAALRRAVLDELEQAQHAPQGGSSGLDLSAVPRARAALERGDPDAAVELLGGWLMPLSFHLRTPEGRAMPAELRGKLAEALGVLGVALIDTEDVETGQQSLRLSVQYAVDSPAAGEAYARLGEAFLRSERFGEAIGPLRRAVELGAPPERVWPALGFAFFQERRWLAAWGATLEAANAGVPEERTQPLRARLLERIPTLAEWERLVTPG